MTLYRTTVHPVRLHKMKKINVVHKTMTKFQTRRNCKGSRHCRSCKRPHSSSTASTGDNDDGNISIPIKHVNIGCFKYKIEPRNDFRDEEGTRVMGETVSTNEIIYIDNSFTPTVVRETLMHELLHAMLHDTNVLDGMEQEEKLVQILSPRLMSLFKDNPRLYKFLIE